MAHTNRGRVILGGLLAGLIINVVELIVNAVVLRASWRQALNAHGIPEFSAGTMVVFLICGFLLGIASVWLYAAIRPRYGMGPGSAFRAGLAAWAIGAFLPNLATYPMGLFPGWLIVTATIVSLFEILLGTFAGAAIYKEKLMEVARPAAAA